MAVPTPFPSAGMELTTILVVSDVSVSTRWYRDVLGAELYREYGGTSAVCGRSSAIPVISSRSPRRADARCGR